MGGYICKKCGAVLDPGEKCKCEETLEKASSGTRKKEMRLVGFEERDGRMYAVVR